jgi:hypothetical protein
MARKTTSPETIARIREEVSKGKTRDRVALDLGIHCNTVQKYSVGLGNRPHLQVPMETRRLIREDLLSGLSNARIAAKYGVSTKTVSRIAAGVFSDQERLSIRGSTLAAVRIIMDKSYVKSLKKSQAKLLLRLFPQLRSSVVNGTHVLYIEKRACEAASAYMGDLGTKVMEYSDLAEVKRAFGIDEKRERAKKRSYGLRR